MDASKHRLIRGVRILQQLEETSYSQLQQNTLNFRPPASPTARQHAVNSIQIQKVEFIPARLSNTLQVKITVSSEGHTYQSSLMFSEVIYDDADQADNVTFKASDNKEYHIIPIELAKNNVKVHCQCLDFYYRFARYNSKDGSLLGKPPPPYQRKLGSTRPSVNPQKVPGVCKHLIKAIITLKNIQVVR